MYYKRLTYIIMGLRRITVSKLETQENWCVVPGRIQRLEQQNWWSCSSSKAGSLETQEEPMFSLKPKDAKKKRTTSQLKESDKSELLLISLFVLWRSSTDEMRLTQLLGRAICCNQSVESNVNPIQKYPLWQLTEQCFPKYLGIQYNDFI